METQQKGRRRLVYVIVGILVGIAMCTLLFYAYVDLQRAMSSPKPEITKLDGYGGFQTLNYVFYVDITVKNNGEEGNVIVYAEISKGAGKYEKQEQLVYLAKGESKNLRFTFDVSFWNTLFSQIKYKAWSVPQ